MYDIDVLRAAGLTQAQIDNIVTSQKKLDQERLLAKREYERQRKRSWRNNNKNNTDVPGTVPGTSRTVPGTNSVPGTPEILQQNQRSCPGDTPLVETQSLNNRVRESRRGVAREIESNWTPNSDGLLLADARGLSGKNLDEEVAKFRDYYLARGTPMADWNAAWRNWLRSPYRGKETGHAVRQPTDRRERELQRWEDTIAQLKAYGQGKGSFPGGADVGLFPPQQGR